MSLIKALSNVLAKAREEYEAIKKGGPAGRGAFFKAAEIYGGGENILAHGDNALFLGQLLGGDGGTCGEGSIGGGCATGEDGGMEGRVQMIYMDPPFFSNADYKSVVTLKGGSTAETKRQKQHSYGDRWEGGMEEYLKMLALRLLFAKALLNDTGTVWIHLDWHSVHYVKVVADEIFGERNFVNEIIWTYKSGGSSKRHFARKHDTILVYAKTGRYYLKLPKEKSYNRGLKPYNFKGVEEFEDQVGWYTMVNMRDVWSIDMVGRTSAERTGYATQKPEALLKRIIEASTEEGHVCMDFFCGSGTLAEAASALGRRWICCDMGSLAVECTLRRALKYGNREGAGVTVMREAGCHLPCGAKTVPAGGAGFECADGQERIEPDVAGRGRDGRSPLKRFLVEMTGIGSSCTGQTCEGQTCEGQTCEVQTCEGCACGETGADERSLTLCVFDGGAGGQGSAGGAQGAGLGAEPGGGYCLIDGVAVDFHFDGSCFRGEKFMYRELSAKAGRTDFAFYANDFEKIHKIMVKVIDVFGNYEYNILDVQSVEVTKKK